MIVIKTANGDRFINEAEVKNVQHNKSACIVTIKFKDGTFDVAYGVESMYYTNKADTEIRDNGLMLGCAIDDAEYWKEMCKSAEEYVKRLCEKNGYYDSLRGKKPSEKTVQGSKQYWKDVREGRREHPFVIQKREDPKGYRKSTEKRRQSRRELWRKERLRALYMTGRKTRLRVALCPYRVSQMNHRSNALKRGYLLDEDCREGQPGRYVIYYDRDTQRSAAFERNCIKDGFTFKEA